MPKCPHCGGTGKVGFLGATCSECQGKGVVGKQCSMCKGTGKRQGLTGSYKCDVCGGTGITY